MNLKKNRFIIALVFSISIFCVATATYAQSPPLKLNLSFNQPKYVPGDTAFFRGWLLNAYDLKPVKGKKVISFILLGSDKKTYFHNRIVFQDGFTANQFALSAASDQYTLLAFSEDSENAASPIFQTPFLIAGDKKFAMNDNKAALTESEKLSILIKTDKENYSVRQPATVQVNIADATGKSLEADFSVSVIYNDLFENMGSADFFNLSMKAQPEANPLNNSKAMAYYFKGKVVTESPLKDSTLVTFYLNRNDFVYPLYITDPKGNFEFPLFKDFGDERVYYTITRRGAKVNGTIISDESMIKKDSIRTTAAASNEDDKYSSFAKKRNVVMKSFLYYSNRLPQDNYEEWLDSDFDIELDKFEPFSSMQELLGNIVQMVRYRKKDNEEIVRVFLRDNAIYATVDPLYIIDGVMMDNTKYFLNLLPANIDRIGILRSQAALSRYGELGKNGILLVRTKPTSREELPSNQHELLVTGINKPVPFTSPSYASEKQSSIPDLRSTLYWNPKIATDNQGKASFSFYTGDATGSFKIRMEGITKNGILFRKEIPFTVSYEKP